MLLYGFLAKHCGNVGTPKFVGGPKSGAGDDVGSDYGMVAEAEYKYCTVNIMHKRRR